MLPKKVCVLAACFVLACACSPTSGARLTAAGNEASALITGRGLQQASNATPPAHVAQLSTLLASLGPGRPVTLKNVETAILVAYAQASSQPEEPSVLTELPTGPVLVSWQNSSAAVAIAFAANASSLAFNDTEAGFSPTAVLPFLQGDFAGAYATPAATDAFFSLLDGSAAGGRTLEQLIANVSSGAEVRRVVCTGYGDGGALAELCGVWAATTFPRSQVRVIAFGAPSVGNVQFAFAFQQLVDLSYLWSTSTHLNVTNATVAGLVPTDEVRVLNDTKTVADSSIPANSFEQYVSAVVEYYNATSGDTRLGGNSTGQDQGGISGFFNNVVSTVQSIVGVGQNLGAFLDVVQSYAYRGDESEALDRAQQADAAAARRNATDCPPLLCKIRPLATAACEVYNNGSGTIAPGSVQIGPVNSTGTQLAVAWNATAKTATFVFKGSTSREDWLTDFRVALNDANTNTALDQFYPDVQLHTGFLASLQSVTEKASTPSENITAVLYQLSGGEAPTLIKISGHSLGAAVATIAGAWAALQWPAADVQVATFGSPMPGNAMFAELLKLLAGRQQRVVHTLDVVPALPPLENYFPVDYGRWIPRNNTVVLQDRPPGYSFRDELNWNDHSCRLYEANVYRAPYTTPPSNLTAVLVNSTLSGGSPGMETAASASEGSAPSSGSPSDSGSGGGSAMPTDAPAGSAPTPAPTQGNRPVASARTAAVLLTAACAVLALCAL